jgi:hypothetical protein
MKERKVRNKAAAAKVAGLVRATAPKARVADRAAAAGIDPFAPTDCLLAAIDQHCQNVIRYLETLTPAERACFVEQYNAPLL